MEHTVRDYGAPRAGRENVRLNATVLAACVAAVMAGAAIWSLQQQKQQIAQSTVETHAEEIVGPPCPAVANNHFTHLLRPTNVFDWNGVYFGRRFGAVDCSAIAKKSLLGNGYQLVCQFSSPAVLGVRSAKGLFLYEPGLGREATLFVNDGVPRCVLASPYFARWKQAVTETDSTGAPTFGPPARDSAVPKGAPGERLR